jgi:hypothetical protein
MTDALYTGETAEAVRADLSQLLAIMPVFMEEALPRIGRLPEFDQLCMGINAEMRDLSELSGSFVDICDWLKGSGERIERLLVAIQFGAFSVHLAGMEPEEERKFRSDAAANPGVALYEYRAAIKRNIGAVYAQSALHSIGSLFDDLVPEGTVGDIAGAVDTFFGGAIEIGDKASLFHDGGMLESEMNEFTGIWWNAVKELTLMGHRILAHLQDAGFPDEKILQASFRLSKFSELAETGMNHISTSFSPELDLDAVA